jgi:hypothetical protein
LLLLTIALGVLGMMLAIDAPVVAVALRPPTLRLLLIGSIVGIFPAFALLPAPATLALTRPRRTVALPGHLRSRYKMLTARGTASLAHTSPPHDDQG